MPIYAYKCGSCGFAKDVLQKISDAPLSQCPECKAEAFSKQLTAPGFQLKGTGWYATDFKNGGSNTKPAAKPGAESADAGSASTATADASAAPAATPAPVAATPVASSAEAKA